jgi:hypothetical protein
MPTELTIEERARRRANRRNRKLQKEMPLFADALQPGAAMSDWLTTVDDARADLVANQKRSDEHRAAMLAFMEKSRVTEAAERQEAIANKTPDEIAFLDNRRRIYPDDPTYGIEFWRRAKQPGWIEAERERLADLQRRGELFRARQEKQNAS